MPAFPSITVHPRASRRLAAALVIAHVATLAALALVAVPAWAHAALAVAVLASLALAVREHVLHAGDAIVRVESTAAGRWRVGIGTAEPVPAELATDNLVLPWLTVLAFRLADGRRRSVILVPDNVPADDFRRLRVIARHARGAGG